MKVVSKDLAKQLHKKGYPQEDCSMYLGLKDITYILLYPVYNGFVSETGNWHARDEFTKFYAMPLADEILERLPDRIQRNNLNYGFRLWFVDYTQYVRHYCCNYFVMDHGKEGRLIEKDFIVEQGCPDALAKMYLYLDKEGLLEKDK